MRIKKIIVTLLLVGFICSVPSYQQIIETARSLSVPLTLVIDPGHGGMDGGASAADGTKEQNINLAIAKALQKEAEACGIKVVLTRTGEGGLYEGGRESASEKWSKVGDMRERKRIIDEIDPDLVISIHLNSFISDTSVHGAQVFYPKEGAADLVEENKIIAEKIQQSLKKDLGEGADRIVLPKNGIYLFKNNERNMILVECGFLSNSDDLVNLQSQQYQQKVAAAMIKAVCEHYGLEVQKGKRTRVIDSRTESRG